MILEIAIEMCVFVACMVAAYVFGWRRVHLIDRPIVDDDFIIAPPKRKKNRTAIARKLRRQYKRRNARAEIDSESIIVLPSVSESWTVGVVLSCIVGALVDHNHFRGIVKWLEALADHDIDQNILFASLAICALCVAIAAFMAVIVIPHASMEHAHAIARNRLKKGRTARFAQNLSIDEVFAIVKWAAKEEVAERRERSVCRRVRTRRELCLDAL